MRDGAFERRLIALTCEVPIHVSDDEIRAALEALGARDVRVHEPR